MGDEGSNHAMYESTLLGILQHEGQIEPFLDVIFGFLYKCTDFYRIQKPLLNTKEGFPPGVAEKLTLAAFRKYERQAKRDDQEREAERKKNEPPELPKCKIVELPDTVDEQPSAVVEESKKESGNKEVEEMTPPVEEEEEKLTEEEKLLKKQQIAFQARASSYNGAERENYSWSQNIKELDVHVKVPLNVTKGRQVKVDIKHTSIRVEALVNGANTILLEGDVCFKLNVEKSFWTLHPGEAVQLNLEKKDERWWDGLLTTEPKINIRNIDASRPIDDLGEEEQAKIHELMFNEQQKRMGKPTSEQLKMQNILREAWDKEGSPFKGQPFDPTAVNVSASGDMLFAQSAK